MSEFCLLTFLLPTTQSIQPYILAHRLIRHFSLDEGLVLRLLDFLSQRTQRVKIGPHVSDIRKTNTGFCLFFDSTCFFKITCLKGENDQFPEVLVFGFLYSDTMFSLLIERKIYVNKGWQLPQMDCDLCIADFILCFCFDTNVTRLGSWSENSS